MSSSQLRIQLLSPSAIVPTRGTPGSAGYDLYSIADVVIPKRGRVLVPTGIKIAVPDGYYGRIAPRSGLALKQGIETGAGVVDSDYRGEISVLLLNHSDVDVSISSGSRIAQIILTQIITPDVVVCDCLDSTSRGENGFGSTGGVNSK